MKLEFPIEEKMLGMVLQAVPHCAGNPVFSIQYTVSDPEPVKNQLLAKAVEDLKVKAKVLSDAAGVKLGDILSVDYSWGEIDIVNRPMENLLLSESCDSDASNLGYLDEEIDPDDIDFSDTVTVVWGIS